MHHLGERYEWFRERHGQRGVRLRAAALLVRESRKATFFAADPDTLVRAAALGASPARRALEINEESRHREAAGRPPAPIVRRGVRR
jgi:hypothetical protein